MRLTKGMYGSEFNLKSDLFGLACGQMRCGGKLTHNSGWYNKSGEKLGWGDLSVADFARIRDGLEEGELFIILCEGDSFWNFVKHNPGIIGSMCKTAPTADAPGVEYVAEHAAYIISTKEVCYVAHKWDTRRGPENVLGLIVQSIGRDDVQKIISDANKQ